MPKPQEVNPKNFELVKVLFDNGDFSIASGTWNGKEGTIVMRWNGDDENDMGYPKTFGHPMWFVVHDDLKKMILKGIIEIDASVLLK